MKLFLHCKAGMIEVTEARRLTQRHERDGAGWEVTGYLFDPSGAEKRAQALSFEGALDALVLQFEDIDGAVSGSKEKP